ncbi:hypothetical protein GCM10023085_02010 [Actinomadura viridis]|uniref:PPOX class probable F420-dependent enzyme n=1 Tax=Actinomadura viridis TaxID=58110 RepID=A0A931DNU0_9ACTN|nr:PPOX class F420-dependent oxidoreductase [Actinomadura viridis]MBG6091021.1 PPOX class probable F420-dependent enzyme [Actinomadura viridis]
MSIPTPETLKKQRTVLLTTYKRDGTPVGTPVNVVVLDGRVYFRTYHTAWKVRRLRNDPRATIAPSRFLGEPTGPAARGRARPLDDAEAEPVRRALARKHPFQQGVLVPLAHRLMRLRTTHYEFILEDAREAVA